MTKEMNMMEAYESYKAWWKDWVAPGQLVSDEDWREEKEALFAQHINTFTLYDLLETLCDENRYRKV